jgi:L-threonylcarbamoyladenylate synthase
MKPALVDASSEHLDRAAATLRGGGVVAFPTETVYGLGADAFDATAVARIFEIKNRPAFDPLIVHVLDEAMLRQVAEAISPAAAELADRFWPGPLTLVLPKRPEVPDIVTAGLSTVAVRMPAHPVARALLERAGRPLAAPSANPFGYLSPTRAEHVARMLGDRVDLILDGGPAGLGLESTIVRFAGRPELLRRGAIAAEEIEAAIGRLHAPDPEAETAPLSPGRLPQHYAPATPIRIVEFARVPQEERAGAAALAFNRVPAGYAHVRVLSGKSELREAASRFFEYLHELDDVRPVRIDAEQLPEVGLGATMMERLRRAAASS